MADEIIMEKIENTVEETINTRYPEKTTEEIAENVRLRISVIGIGNAGSQVIAKAHGEHMNVFAINTSYKDLQSGIINASIPSFIAGDEARGAGKDRNRSKELFKVNGKNLFRHTEFTRMVDSSDIVFVVASTAGGSGSGIAPEVVRLFKQIYSNKIIVFYGIIPKLADSTLAQYNTIETIDEIDKLEVPYLLADLSYYEDVANDQAYEKIAEHIIFSINTLAGNFLFASKHGMLDENDMRVILSQPGYLGVYAVNDIKAQQLENKTVQSLLVDRLKRSPACVTQQDHVLKHMGFIENCPSSMIESSRTGNYNELISYTGKPLAIFENLAVTNMPVGQFILILSGMNTPYNRLSECRAIIEEYEERNKNIAKVNLGDEVSKFKHLAESADISRDSRKRPDNEKMKSALDDFFGAD